MFLNVFNFIFQYIKAQYAYSSVIQEILTFSTF